MSLTPYHAKYFAHELTRRWPSDSVEKFAAALVDARVHLNPHQVEAALFAFKSPLSKGALLADEVGLGKTIEAGLLISQRWAERKRRILIITPANLRKQWHQEMAEKFFLPCHILEAKTFKAALKAGKSNPFEVSEIVICSYQFAAGKDTYLSDVPWDLVVIDEAHRLRNVWKPDNKTANKLKNALMGCDKVLLTATPLQNSLMELYGLVSFIDEQVFNDDKSFREQFSSVKDEDVFQSLKARLKPICHRTLRRQVLNVKFTARHPLVEEFITSEKENELYDLVSAYLQREHLAALPKGQRALITMVLRKLLASSTFAIAGALEKLASRLEGVLAALQLKDLEDDLDEDFEALDESAEEWPIEEPELFTDVDKEFIKAEIKELRSFRELAVSIEHNSKGKALLKALGRAFTETERLGGARKAIIFTESRRTQEYLLDLLSKTEYGDGLLLFNGSNTDERSKRIYSNWKNRYQGTDRVTGSRTADMRSALVDYFREDGSIMIATEAAAEGINLQFCSLLVNYDLPWNPQRIEQRIGRCHRYGQQHDVVVLNFVNRANAADQRVFELLNEKFKLFDGVFGASDEVLGALESGVDIERRIADIYQKCRTKDEIKDSFDALQLELQFEIDEAMTRTRQQLIEHFDDEVRDKLVMNGNRTEASLNRYQQLLMRLSSYELAAYATFEDERRFNLHTKPFGLDLQLGEYELPQLDPTAHDYRLGTPLAEQVVRIAKERATPTAEVVFDLSDHTGNVSVLKPFVGQRGLLTLQRVTVESMDTAEDHLVLVGHTAIGEVVPPDVLQEFFRLDAVVRNEGPGETSELLAKELETRKLELQREVNQRNLRFYEDETTKLDGWAEDQKIALERDIKEMDKQIRDMRRTAAASPTLEEKLRYQKEMRSIEQERTAKRKALFEAQDAIDKRRDELISAIEGKLEQRMSEDKLFTVNWHII
ncbi:MAG: SNF2-related protein [Flavobacteriales bacterium]